jgi:threonine dehydrogenase-like Zn-dependent dehydrogenase
MGILNADGAFAEYVSVPAGNLHFVPENVNDEEAVFTEPLAAAFEILTQIQITPGDEVLVLGDGKLGVRAGAAAHRRESDRARQARRQTGVDQESRRADG